MNSSLLPDLIIEFKADVDSLTRFYTVKSSPTRRARFERLFQEYLVKLSAVDFENLDRDGKADYLLFANHLGMAKRRSELDGGRIESLMPTIPFAATITSLVEARQRMETMDGEGAAGQLAEIREGVRCSVFGVRKDDSPTSPAPTPPSAALGTTKDLREKLKEWFDYYNGYDPAFSWWTKEPYGEVDRLLGELIESLEKAVAGGTETAESIGGTPVGREALIADLAFEMIPYTPEELIAMGEKEYAWCESEMLRASQQLGFGDDWPKAVEHVKGLTVEPGRQTDMVRDMAYEAIEYVESRDLLTVPETARETWRMKMMSPEAQKTNPFFLGGEVIQVSFPTDTMTHEQKRMSMRGNNRHFSRCTVQHELIPGHHMQQYMCERYRPYRQLFSTPFWIEGWTLHWEMLLWDLGFPQGPEDRIGMLFWRMHRCVRIVFSLRYHLGEMSAQECIEMLVERVRHERANAEGEVRRSLNGNYPPLYQAAYMIGGKQVRALHKEVVGSGKMSAKEFHDTFLKQNEMPIAVLRAIMLDQPLAKDTKFDWRFLDT